MRTATTTFTASLLIASLLAPATALAAPKPKGDVTITDTGTALVVTGTIIGVGNLPLSVSLGATVTTTTQCRNPGGSIVEAQVDEETVTPDPVLVPVDKNGKATIDGNDVILTASPVVDACKPKWTEVNIPPPTIDFSNVSLTITQGGTTVFECGVSGAPACVIS